MAKKGGMGLGKLGTGGKGGFSKGGKGRKTPGAGIMRGGGKKR